MLEVSASEFFISFWKFKMKTLQMNKQCIKCLYFLWLNAKIYIIQINRK